MEQPKHIPVLLNETLEALQIKQDGVYVDCTMGGAGHSSHILQSCPQGYLYCFEQDEYAVERGGAVLAATGQTNYTIIHDNFENLTNELNRYDAHKVDGFLYDLGVSSFQLDMGERGFSYNKEAPLDMRMDQSKPLTAFDIVNTYSEKELSRIFHLYGEEDFAYNIARKIGEKRHLKPIETTTELAEIVISAKPAKARRDGHPAKQVFQALRIAVNRELDVFESSLKQALTHLNKGGRICVITFHSLEDRICMNIFKDACKTDVPSDLPIPDKDIKRDFKIINRKAIMASAEELAINPRSHSARLRILEKL